MFTIRVDPTMNEQADREWMKNTQVAMAALLRPLAFPRAELDTGLELTRFRGFPITWGIGAHDAEKPEALPAGVSPADGRARARGAYARGAVT